MMESVGFRSVAVFAVQSRVKELLGFISLGELAHCFSSSLAQG
jgi:hypothetical protein